VKGDDLSDRLVTFGVRNIRLVSSLPKNVIGRHIGGQMVRSGTSAGANYEEARGAESRPDFIHKLGISWKETRETWYWLKVVHRTELVKPKLVEKLLQEAHELSLILGKALATARGKGKPPDRLTFRSTATTC
jgi:four helix bundle protein